MKENKIENLNKAIYGDPTLNTLSNDIKVMDLVRHPNFDARYIVVGMHQSMKVKKNKIKVLDTYILRSVTFKEDMVSIDKNYTTVSYDHGECDLVLISPISKKKSRLSADGYLEYNDVDGEFMKFIPVDIKIINPFDDSEKESIHHNDDYLDDLAMRVMGLESSVEDIFDTLSAIDRDRFSCNCGDCQEDSDELKNDWSDLEQPEDHELHDDEQEADLEDCIEDEPEIEGEDDELIETFSTNNGLLHITTNSGLEFLSDCKNLSVSEMHDKYGISKYEKYCIRDRLCEHFGFDKESFKGPRGGHHRK